MNYRMLMNFGILLFVLLTLQCNNATSPNNNGNIIGTWVGGNHAEVWTFIKDSLSDTLYDTGVVYKTYSITYNTIKISQTSSGFHFRPLPVPPSPLIGTWSIINDSLIIYPVSYVNAFSTRYLITKHLPDSLIFSSSDGIDTCVKQ